uniref:class I SAM-dependent methyltransferase n=1 Tax=Herbidospora sakaeratensis TaxID=564415 RepID=UPI000782D079|nr:class I SAM-dependent methyltransferase [Herbidospora sakaeratensis]
MLDWDHNAYYHRLLLGHLPPDPSRVLDVGCGTGGFAAELAARAAHVDALDRSPEMIEQAAKRDLGNVSWVLGDVLTDPLPGRDYDGIFSICALHHMPLREVLPILSAALRPGGVLAAIALPRLDLFRESHVELAAAAGHRALGAAYLTRRRLNGGGGFFAKEPAHDAMPMVLNPPLTTREVAREAAVVLPGVRVRRLVFWRYLLTWEKPAG